MEISGETEKVDLESNISALGKEVELSKEAEQEQDITNDVLVLK